MKKTMTFIAAMTALTCAGVASADVTYTSTWDDQSGPAFLTTYDGSNDNLTVGYSDQGYNDNTGWYMQESGLAGTPNATAAWITGLQEGDTVTVSMWFRGTDSELGTSKGRLWGHYTANDDIDAYAASASGAGGYAGASFEWELQEHTWTIAAGQTALAVEARIYSSPSTDPKGSAMLFGDDMTVTVSNDLATVNMAGTIPAPGALALIGLAGIASRRRRA